MGGWDGVILFCDYHLFFAELNFLYYCLMMMQMAAQMLHKIGSASVSHKMVSASLIHQFSLFSFGIVLA